jgi:hypothetical protein
VARVLESLFGSGSVSEPLVTDRSEGQFGGRIILPRAGRQMAMPGPSCGLGQCILPPNCTSCFDRAIQTDPLLVINLNNNGTQTNASGRQVILSSRESLALVKIQGKWVIVNHQASAMR